MKSLKKIDTIKKKNHLTKDGKLLHVFNKHWTESEINILADELLDWIKQDDNFWIKDFCLMKNISRQGISNFKQRSEYFNYIYEMVQDHQESKLLHLGLSGSNVSMIIFALKHNHKWTDENSFNFQTTHCEVVIT